MPWVRLDDSFSEHPKIAGLSDSAYRLHVDALCFSGRQLTDGLIVETMLPRITSAKAPVKAAGELVDAGVWEATAGGWWIHDYLSYQPSKDDVLATREVKSAGGVKGNHRRWHVGKGVVDPACPLCIADRSDQRSLDRSDLRSVDRLGSESPRPVPSRPDPSPSSSSSGETPTLHAVEDDDEWINQVAAAAAARCLERCRADGRTVHTPSAWLATVRRQITTDHGQALADLRRARPDLDVDDAVLWLEGAAVPRPSCSTCGNLGVVELPDGRCADCPTCKAAS